MMTEQLVTAAPDADIDDIAQMQDRAKSAIMNVCSPTALAFIEQWCTAHNFKIKGRMSEHVISLSRVSKYTSEVVVSSEPGTSNIHSKTSSAHETSLARGAMAPHKTSSARGAEHIFNVAMGLEEPDDDAVAPQKAQMSRCDICVELSNHAK